MDTTCTCTKHQICDICTPPPNIQYRRDDPEVRHYERMVAKYGKDHIETIRVGAFLGLLSICLIILPILTGSIV
jgi:hypothetical protein